MNLDEWVDLIKHAFGPGEFKSIAIEFLRELYGDPVLYTDGKGDGGIDAWVSLTSEPRLRVAAQFYAGKAEPWDKKLEDDVTTMCAFRDSLASDNPLRLELQRLYFVCTQTPDARKAEEVVTDILHNHRVSVRIFDARAIAGLALQNRGHLLGMLAQRLPGAAEADRREPLSARDELLLAFSFFQAQPTKYRIEVAKSAIATVLHRSERALTRDELLCDAAHLLRLSPPSKTLERTLRNLASERNVTIDGERVLASTAFAERTATALRIAAADETKMRERCAAALAPILRKGVHGRADRAKHAVDAIFGDLGLLIRTSVAERALPVVDRNARRSGRMDDELRRWQVLERRLADELELDHDGLKRALAELARAAAESPFAKSLAAAELFLQITEYEAHELTAVLASSSPLRVTLDASIAMPMLCALYDRPAAGWETSVAAHALYESLRTRGARLIVPSVYVEEIAAHLMKARGFEGIVETETELERSGNFFVAHFCSTRGEGEARSAGEFRDFLCAFGAPRSAPGQWQHLMGRRKVEDELRKIFVRYGLEIADIIVRPDDPDLVDEPPRDDVLLRHDRAVVRWLMTQKSTEPVLCTADRWLQGVLAELGHTALDSAALADILELVRPLGESRGLVSPLVVAQALTDADRALAASVWDQIVALESHRLADWELVKRAREFRNQWLARRREPSSLSGDWIAFRNAASLADEGDGTIIVSE